MESLPQYLLIGVAAGLVVILFFRQLRLAVQILTFMAKAVIIVILFLLVGSLIGWWELPRPVSILLFGLSRLLEPLREVVLGWFADHLP